MFKLKKFIFDHMKNNSFIIVLLMASVPNPLFDLAGLTCGHLQISFWTFFVATSIGKGLIKVNIQVLSIIFIFSKQTLDSLIDFIKSQKQLEFIGIGLEKTVRSQRRKLLNGNGSENSESWLGMIWNLVLALIIGYFVVSLINSKVRGHYLRDKKSN